MTLTAAEISRMQDDIAGVIADNPVDLVFRRAGANLPAAQRCRVELATTSNFRAVDEAMKEQRADVYIFGALDAAGNLVPLDILIDDEFNFGGIGYRVSLVHPNKQIVIQAEGILRT